MTKLFIRFFDQLGRNVRRGAAAWLLTCVLLLTCLAFAQMTGCNHSGPSPDQEDPTPISSCASGFSNSNTPIDSCRLDITEKGGLVDNFQDHNFIANANDGRSGRWYLFTDDTSGCVDMSIDADKQGSSLRVAGSGFQQWGAGFGVSLAYDDQSGKTCTYDLTKYTGIRLRARGNTALRMIIPTRKSTIKSLGGDCPDAEGCFDVHGQSLALTSEWQNFEIDFCSLRQDGWGVPLGDFDPATATGLNFLAFTTGAFEVWIDDVEFIPQTNPQTDDAPFHCGPICPIEQLPAGITYDPGSTPLLGGAPGLSLFTFNQQTENCGPMVRRYLARIPETVAQPSSEPVVILLPGASSDAESMHDFMTNGRFAELADRDQFILVYGNAAPGPATVPERPNGGMFYLKSDTTTTPELDDKKYLELIINDLIDRGIVTGNNPVFLAGHSNGGALALEAWLATPERYAGIAAIMPYVGNVTNPPEIPDEASVKGIFVAYTHDDPGLPEGHHNLIESLIQNWASALSIQPDDPTQIQTTPLEDRVVEGKENTDSGATVRRTRDSHCKQIDYGNPDQPIHLRVLELDHAGHFWPTPNPYEDESITAEYGLRNQDIDMSTEIWNFFTQLKTESE
jgi:poly(3-hydroxybutyrate) depolymerase